MSSVNRGLQSLWTTYDTGYVKKIKKVPCHNRGYFKNRTSLPSDAWTRVHIHSNNQPTCQSQQPTVLSMCSPCHVVCIVPMLSSQWHWCPDTDHTSVSFHALRARKLCLSPLFNHTALYGLHQHNCKLLFYYFEEHNDLIFFNCHYTLF